MKRNEMRRADEGVLILDIDIALAEERKKWKAVVAEKDVEMAEKEAVMAEKEAKMKAEMAEKDSIIEKLQARIQELERGTK